MSGITKVSTAPETGVRLHPKKQGSRVKTLENVSLVPLQDHIEKIAKYFATDLKCVTNAKYVVRIVDSESLACYGWQCQDTMFRKSDGAKMAEIRIPTAILLQEDQTVYEYIWHQVKHKQNAENYAPKKDKNQQLTPVDMSRDRVHNATYMFDADTSKVWFETPKERRENHLSDIGWGANHFTSKYWAQVLAECPPNKMLFDIGRIVIESTRKKKQPTKMIKYTCGCDNLRSTADYSQHPPKCTKPRCGQPYVKDIQ